MTEEEQYMSMERYYRLINTSIGKKLKEVLNGLVPGLIPEPVPVKVPVRRPQKPKWDGRGR